VGFSIRWRGEGGVSELPARRVSNMRATTNSRLYDVQVTESDEEMIGRRYRDDGKI
jgi:hypothetical protein